MMPELVHFSEVQKREIRKELIYFLHPYRVRFYLVLTGFLVGITLALYGYSTTQSHQDTQLHELCRSLNALEAHLRQPLTPCDNGS